MLLEKQLKELGETKTELHDRLFEYVQNEFELK